MTKSTFTANAASTKADPGLGMKFVKLPANQSARRSGVAHCVLPVEVCAGLRQGEGEKGE